jgi:hypothetical protein
VRALVCGGRDYTNWPFFSATLGRLLSDYYVYNPTVNAPYGNWCWDLVIISGKAPGADTMAEQWALLNYVSAEIYPADWESHGKRAGYLRNKQMLEEGHPDLVIAFPGGKGTAMMVRLAKDAGVNVIEVTE